jgi:hypothetical protein
MIQESIKDLSNKTLCPTEDMVKFVDCLRGKSMNELIKTTDFISSQPKDKIIHTAFY